MYIDANAIDFELEICLCFFYINTNEYKNDEMYLKWRIGIGMGGTGRVQCGCVMKI